MSRKACESARPATARACARAPPAADSRSLPRAQLARRSGRADFGAAPRPCARGPPRRRCARPPSDGAQLGGVGDRLAHAGDAALFDQVGDQLQFADAFEVGDLGRDPARDQRLEPGDQQFRDRAPHHRLLVEQVGLGLLGEARRDQPGAGAADRAAIGEGDRRAPCRSRPAPPPTRRSCLCPRCRASAAPCPGPLGAIRNTSRSARGSIRPKRIDRPWLKPSAAPSRSAARSRDRAPPWISSGASIMTTSADAPRPRPGRSSGRPPRLRRAAGSAAKADDHVDAAVVEVERLGAALVAVAEDRDALAGERGGVDVGVAEQSMARAA